VIDRRERTKAALEERKERLQKLREVRKTEEEDYRNDDYSTQEIGFTMQFTETRTRSERPDLKMQTEVVKGKETEEPNANVEKKKYVPPGPGHYESVHLVNLSENETVNRLEPILHSIKNTVPSPLITTEPRRN
jgi:hypothetical protein